MFLGWHDADKKYPTANKVADACARYEEKFGAEPEIVLCHPSHEAELDGCYIFVRTVNYIPVNTFYVGVEEPDAITLMLTEESTP